MITLFFSMLHAAEQVNNMMPSGTNKILQIFGQFLPFLLIIIIFYFFLIRPQNKQKEALNKMIQSLKKGDKIITKGGIVGKIEEVKENHLIIELYDGSKMEILKHAVISMVNEL